MDLLKQTINKMGDLISNMKIMAYLSALRPWSFSASLMPVLLAYTLAYKGGSETSLLSFVITILTILTVHTAGNVVNTYYDYIKGIDNPGGDDRILVNHLLTKEETTILGVVLYSFGCCCFLVLLLICPAKWEHLTIVYFGGLSSSFLYTGGVGFKYIGLGDLVILIIFGPITLMFSYIVQTGQVNWGVALYAIPMSLGCEAIFHSNNTRDLQMDKKAGIMTLCILIGLTASELLYALFLLIPYSMFTVFGLKYSKWMLLPLVTLPTAFDIERSFRTVSKHDIPKRTAKLNLYTGLLYIFGLFLADKNSLPFLNIES